MAETPIEWYRRMKAEAAPFEAAEKQFLCAAPGDSDAGVAACRALEPTSRAFGGWLDTNPCPDPEVSTQFRIIVSDYAEIARLMLAFASDPGSSREATLVARVEHLMGEIKVHEAAISKWVKPLAP